MTAPGSASIAAAIRAGGRALGRYPGLALSVYAIQVGISAAAAFVIARVLAAAFATSPIFDRGLAGDLPALLGVLADHPEALAGAAVAGTAAVLVYVPVSWFLFGGLASVFAAGPRGRREVAERFGGGGAALLFPYLRLALVSVPVYATAGAALAIGAVTAESTLERALTAADLAVAAAALLPAAALAVLARTVVEYARIDLARHPGLGSARALLRAVIAVFTSWRPLAHALLYYLAFAAVTAGYAWLVSGHGAAVGTASVLALVGLRQLTAGARFAARVATIAGQVELSRALQGPPLSRHR